MSSSVWHGRWWPRSALTCRCSPHPPTSPVGPESVQETTRVTGKRKSAKNAQRKLLGTAATLRGHLGCSQDQENTSARLLMLSAGTFSQQTGSWKCRLCDGKLVVTLLWANYFPTTDAINHPSTVPNPPPVDLVVGNHVRGTLLFSVTDVNTLTLTESRSRTFDPTQDPTHPRAPSRPRSCVQETSDIRRGSACSLKASAFSGKGRLARAKLIRTVLPH